MLTLDTIFRRHFPVQNCFGVVLVRLLCYLRFVEAKQLLYGMLGAKLIGFQDYSYVRHCLNSYSRVLGMDHTPTGLDVDGSSVYFTVLPMGLDVGKAEAIISGEKVAEHIRVLRDIYGGKKLLVGIDKSEQIKGVRHKLEGLRRFFTDYPEWIGKVFF